VPEWGCIADDVTGATDLATNLVSRGYRTVVLLQPFDEIGRVRAGDVHDGDRLPRDLDEVDAVVVALKSRTAPVDTAVAQSRAALEYLLDVGARRIYVKYCSTFDSTPRGNIGPVIDAVLESTGETVTIVVPSFPDAGRTTYRGHLFVGDDPLDESSMRHHPLTPMLDSSVPRLLQPQTRGDVHLVTLPVVRAGEEALAGELRRIESASRGRRVSVVIDAIDRDDLTTIMAGAAALRVVTGGSGLALGLPERTMMDARHIRPVDGRRANEGRRAVLCGSASLRTREQVAHARERLPWQKLDLDALRHDFDAVIAGLADWAEACWQADPAAIPLVYSVDSLDDVARGGADGADLVERAFGSLARALTARGATRLIVAGGESSGSVMAELGITRLTIGAEIAPGVAWSEAVSDRGDVYDVALKSGNFGAVDMFTTAWPGVERGRSE